MIFLKKRKKDILTLHKSRKWRLVPSSFAVIQIGKCPEIHQPEYVFIGRSNVENLH